MSTNDSGVPDYDPFRGAAPRATTSADPKEQEKAAKAAKGGRRSAAQTKQAVESGEVTATDALQSELEAGRTGQQRGEVVRDLQEQIAKETDEARPGTAKPPTPVDVDPATIRKEGDPRIDPSVPAPIGGGAAPSVGPGTAAGSPDAR